VPRHVAGEDVGVWEEMSTKASVATVAPPLPDACSATHMSSAFPLESVSRVSSSVSMLSSMGSEAKRFGDG
jgi:hypothetical protein